MKETKTKFEEAFSFWFRVPNKASKNQESNEFHDTLTKLADFDNVEDFWKVFQHIQKPETLKNGFELDLFRSSIRPVWEDPNNKNGGKISLKLRKNFTSVIWEEIILNFIGGNFNPTIKDQINGVVISIRKDYNFLQIWFKNHTESHINEITKEMKKLLQIPEGIEIDVKPFFKNK